MLESLQNTTTIAIPSELIIGNGIKQLSINSKYNLEKSKLLIVSGGNKTSKIALEILNRLNIDQGQYKKITCQSNSFEDIVNLEKQVIGEKYDYIIGIGGGLIIDASKIIGTRIKCPVILIPTALSSDAICSPVARVVISPSKKNISTDSQPQLIREQTKSLSIYVDMPKCVLIDEEILSKSPERLNISGVGDLISNNTANLDWELADKKGKADFNSIASIMATNAVESFLSALNKKTLNRYSTQALGQSLVMSGLAMAIAGSSRPCSGGEHQISHALDHEYGSPATHGQQVAVGTIFSQFAHEQINPATPKRSSEYKNTFSKIGLPFHYEHIGCGIEEFTNAIIIGATKFKKKDRYTILDEVIQYDIKEIKELVHGAFNN